ncbi:MAG TPA: DUF2785 domain-containing protein [Symbiobacteriaceae bacterium]|jgi:hypothetical protein
MDKAFWAAIKANGCDVPVGYTPQALLPELLAGLGSVDPELRDELSLEILGTWLDAGHYPPEDLHRITAQMLVNVGQGLGQGENDLVFLRTFSVLILANLLYCDAQAAFLTGEEFHHMKAAAIEYLATEHDLRGYVPGKGWAHSVAHTADLLAWLARSPRANDDDLADMLDAISRKLLAHTGYACYDKEAFRLGRAVMAILQRDLLPNETLVAWAETLTGSPAMKEAFSAGRDNERQHNLVAFLAALHLMVTYQPDLAEATRAALLQALHGAVRSYVSFIA